MEIPQIQIIGKLDDKSSSSGEFSREVSVQSSKEASDISAHSPAPASDPAEADANIPADDSPSDKSV